MSWSANSATNTKKLEGCFPPYDIANVTADGTVARFIVAKIMKNTEEREFVFAREKGGNNKIKNGGSKKRGTRSRKTTDNPSSLLLFATL